MLQLFDYMKANGGRVILSGDIRQHGAVEASDALRAIEMYSSLAATELTEIRRQDPTKARTPTERRGETLQHRLIALSEAAQSSGAALVSSKSG